MNQNLISKYRSNEFLFLRSEISRVKTKSFHSALNIRRIELVDAHKAHVKEIEIEMEMKMKIEI